MARRKDGFRVPRTGVYEVQKGMTVTPVRKPKKPRQVQRVKKVRKIGRSRSR